jgi:hypothetical protein
MDFSAEIAGCGQKPPRRETPASRLASLRRGTPAARSASSRPALPRHNRPAPRDHDFQKPAVYEWENWIIGEPRPYSDIGAAQDEVDRIASKLSVRSVCVRVAGCATACESYYLHKLGIVLSRRMLDQGTVLHELAHCLVQRMRVREASHGPAFAATLAALHCVVRGYPLTSAFAFAQAFGVALDERIASGIVSRCHCPSEARLVG